MSTTLDADTIAAPPPAAPVEASVPLSRRPRAPARERTFGTKVGGQPAFVLHSYAWRETSLIVEVLSRDFGRMALVARGAKRPTSQFRGILLPFSPLALSWSGRQGRRLAGVSRDHAWRRSADSPLVQRPARFSRAGK